MTHSVVLALDIATRTGFAMQRADGRVESGSISFAPKRGEGPGARFSRFRAWLIEQKQCAGEIHAIAFEEVVAHGPGAQAAHVYGGLLAVLLMFAEHHRIECSGTPVGTIKKRFTGAGNATKGDVIDQCRALGFRPADDNEADAIALLHVALDRCPILTKSGASPKKRAPKTSPAVQAGADPF